MKKVFEAPEMKIENFFVEDVITTSVGGDNTGTGGTDIVNPFG